MGCDIHSYAGKKQDGEWTIVLCDPQPFGWRSYSVFAFLAGVRNYSAITPISLPRGVPSDCSYPVFKDFDFHSHSWLSLQELLAFDFDVQIEDRRCTKQISTGIWDGGQTCAPGEGEITTYRKFLGRGFFDELERLKTLGVERIIFCFDN